MNNYDVIVVGAGHAGSEAAAVAANRGSRVLLITMDMSKIAQMSCNPAIGGIAKGQIVREIDALGGYTGIVTDKTTIQFRMLNKSKGPAMWSPRAQCDRMAFSALWREILEGIPKLDFWQGSVVSLLMDGDKLRGVKTDLGNEFFAPSVVLTAGTFLNGLIYVGRNKVAGGRISEPSSYGLTEQLVGLGFETARMKTGTPPRIDGRSVDFAKLTEQKGDEQPEAFSFSTPENRPLKQLSCYIAYTNLDVHDSLRETFADSPLFNGTIKSVGPRYCPSIEDKIVTFSGKDSHQLFLEPEGVSTVEYYLNGFSSSLPLESQYAALRKIEGFEKVKIFRPGYAIEYDYFAPTQLYHTLETKSIRGLFFAGQINGTTGYEEAAAQGLMSGINAHSLAHDLPTFTLMRDEAYIGVLIDDLVTKGVDEPYRMFTSRAEFRILLRQDNADERLSPHAYKLGLLSDGAFQIFQLKYRLVNQILAYLRDEKISPAIANPLLRASQTSPIVQSVRLNRLLLRPQVSIFDLRKYVSFFDKFLSELAGLSNSILQIVEIRVKYSGYIDRERSLAEKLQRLEYVKIPSGFDYEKTVGLSTEARQKLLFVLPQTIGQASRIVGVSPSDINILLLQLGR